MEQGDPRGHVPSAAWTRQSCACCSWPSAEPGTPPAGPGSRIHSNTRSAVGAGLDRGAGPGPPRTRTRGQGQGQAGGLRALVLPTGELTGGDACKTTREQARQQIWVGCRPWPLLAGSLSFHLWRPEPGAWGALGRAGSTRPRPTQPRAATIALLLCSRRQTAPRGQGRDTEGSAWTPEPTLGTPGCPSRSLARPAQPRATGWIPAPRGRCQSAQARDWAPQVQTPRLGVGRQRAENRVRVLGAGGEPEAT